MISFLVFKMLLTHFWTVCHFYFEIKHLHTFRCLHFVSLFLTKSPVDVALTNEHIFGILYREIEVLDHFIDDSYVGCTFLSLCSCVLSLMISCRGDLHFFAYRTV